MTTVQELKLKMLTALIALLEVNGRALAQIPNGTTYLTALKDARDHILEDIKKQAPASTANKKALRKKLEVSTLNISERLTVFADDRKDNVLKDVVKFTKTELERLTEGQLPNTASILYDKTQLYSNELTPYGITAETMSDFNNDIVLYRQSIPETEMSKLQSKDMTEKVNADFEQAEDVVDSLDLRVELTKALFPQFYRDYKDLRKISVPKHPLAAMGDVTDAETGMPVQNALLVFKLEGKSDVEKHTTELGNFRIQSMENGIYTVTVTKIGYQPQTVNATVTGDETCVVRVRLAK